MQETLIDDLQLNGVHRANAERNAQFALDPYLYSPPLRRSCGIPRGQKSSAYFLVYPRKPQCHKIPAPGPLQPSWNFAPTDSSDPGHGEGWLLLRECQVHLELKDGSKGSARTGRGIIYSSQQRGSAASYVRRDGSR